MKLKFLEIIDLKKVIIKFYLLRLVSLLNNGKRDNFTHVIQISC